MFRAASALFAHCGHYFHWREANLRLMRREFVSVGEGSNVSEDDWRFVMCHSAGAQSGSSGSHRFPDKTVPLLRGGSVIVLSTSPDALAKHRGSTHPRYPNRSVDG